MASALATVFKRKKIRLFLLICLAISLPAFMIFQDYQDEGIRAVVYDGNLPLLYRDIFPNPDEDNFFFTETSYKSSLSSKTLCCIESYCRVHPNATLWMTLTSPNLDEETILHLKELQKICTLHYVATDVFLTLSDTPLKDLPNSPGFWNSRLLFYNLSDLMRLAMVFKSGGLYSDTDLLATQPITNRKNFLVSNGYEVANGIYHFDAGHPFLYDVMKYISNHFYKDIYTMSGPVPVSYVIQKRCPEESKHVKPTWVHQIPQIVMLYAKNLIGDMGDPCEPYELIENTPPKVQFHCKGIDILEPVSYLAVHWMNMKKIFQEPPERSCLSKLRRIAYGIHLTGSMHFDSGAAKGSGLDLLSSLQCPTQYEKTGGNIFLKL